MLIADTSLTAPVRNVDRKVPKAVFLSVLLSSPQRSAHCKLSNPASASPQACGDPPVDGFRNASNHGPVSKDRRVLGKLAELQVALHCQTVAVRVGRSILALGGVSGLAFGLASQNLVGNFMSGRVSRAAGKMNVRFTRETPCSFDECGHQHA